MSKRKLTSKKVLEFIKGVLLLSLIISIILFLVFIFFSTMMIGLSFLFDGFSLCLMF